MSHSRHRPLFAVALATLSATLLLAVAGSPRTARAEFDTYYDVCGSEVTVAMTMVAGFDNEDAIGMPDQKVLEFQCPIGRLLPAANPAALVQATVNSDAPWIFASGELVFNGEMDAEGNGSIGGSSNIHAIFHADITLEGAITGTYELEGFSGGDPNSVYEFVGDFFGSPPTPSPSPSPTAGPGQQVVWGDNNCSDAADPIDSLLTLRFDGGLSTNTGACPAMGVEVEVANASPHLWGDVDCNESVNPVDSLKLLRFDGGLSVAQEPGCPQMGAEVTLLENG